MTQRDEAVRLAVGQHVCRPSQGGSQRAQFELSVSQDRMLCAMLLVLAVASECSIASLRLSARSGSLSVCARYSCTLLDTSVLSSLH